jgi:hypothetical protein
MEMIETRVEQAAELRFQPGPIRRWTSGIVWRLFLTCWLIYGLHLATNTVREIYLALAIGDHFSFQVNEYANMHPDLFEKPGYGWHIGANPGASMIAAIPYAILRPITDRIVDRVQRDRAGVKEPPKYNSPYPMAQQFYQEAWRRGLDVKFALASLIMQGLCMAPISAAGVVAMFILLRRIFQSERAALFTSIVYAFGTPVFFRAGYLNHNMMLGHIAFLGLLALWNPEQKSFLTGRTGAVLGGVCGGLCLLLDYSGVVMLLGLFVYCVAKAWNRDGGTGAWRNAVSYAAGSLGPIALLWFYQWASFGNPIYPGQHWMPPVEWIDVGYQGFGLPQWELLRSLAIDYRYGLFTTCPIMLLALAAWWANRSGKRAIPSMELATMLALSCGLWLFCGGISYTRLQFNTGIRYLAPLFPFMWVPTAIVLMRFGWRLRYFLATAAIAQAWCLAMYRDVERGFGVLEPVIRVFTGGFQLPVLTVLSRLEGSVGDYFAHGVSPLPLFVLTAAVIYGIWSKFSIPHEWDAEE